MAARVLKSLEVDIERARQEVLKELDPNFEEGENPQVEWKNLPLEMEKPRPPQAPPALVKT